MAVDEANRQQEALTPQEDLSAYNGQWVALRDGHVVATNLDPGRLLDDPAVEPTDVIVLVADDPEGVYVL
jgi:hypothetical protein